MKGGRESRGRKEREEGNLKERKECGRGEGKEVGKEESWEELREEGRKWIDVEREGERMVGRNGRIYIWRLE